MINSLDTLVKNEEKKRKSHDFLTKLKEDLQKVEKMGSDSSAELLRKIASDIEENLETQEIKVKLEGVHNFVQDRIENPFIYGFLDKMKEVSNEFIISSTSFSCSSNLPNGFSKLRLVRLASLTIDTIPPLSVSQL
jgi:hypothetical protein